MESLKLALVIPAYRVADKILDVIIGIGPLPSRIYVVDDGCPDGSGELVKVKCQDPRVRVLWHSSNAGVGAAVLTGFRVALEDGAEVIVKLDGDGQMDPALLPSLIASIVSGQADYVKGNRFHALQGLGVMPPLRLFGNSVLSLLAKASTGYWQLLDPTNGYIAIDGRVAALLIDRPLSRRYFFETDLLFHLYLLGAVVKEMPHRPRYGGERSNLRPLELIVPFFFMHLSNTCKRIFFTYYLRSFYPASIELIVGIILTLVSSVFVSINWIASIDSGIPRTSGTVILASTMLIIASQCLLAFLNFDVGNSPKTPLASLLPLKP